MDNPTDHIKMRSAGIRLRSFFLYLKIAITISIFSAVGYIYHVSNSTYVRSESHILIAKGESSRQILRRLHGDGILPPFWVSTGIMLLINGDTKIIAGEYILPAGATPLEVLSQLGEGGSTVAYKLKFTEGVYVQEVLAALRKDKRLTGELAESVGEGELFPDTYHVQRYDRREEVLALMKNKMSSVTKQLLARVTNPYIQSESDLITFASLIQREAANDEEMARISGVFVNRIAKRMRLQSDPTVVYALTEGKFRLNRQLKKEDLKVDSDYNTYRRRGLPKGPICCPGLSALKAAANPQTHDELYFAVLPDGQGHYFSVSYRDHVNYINKHLKNKGR